MDPLQLDVRTLIRNELTRLEWKGGDPCQQYALRLTLDDEINLLEQLLDPRWGETTRSIALVGGARAFPRILGYVIEWGADRSELVRLEDASRDTLLAIVRAELAAGAALSRP